MGKYEFYVAVLGMCLAAYVIRQVFSGRSARRRKCAIDRESEKSVHEQGEAQNEKLRAMEERIRVLEKIVTDRQSDLRDRFRELDKD